MTSFELLKLLGNAQDEYIMDSRKRPKPPKKPPILKIAALAACAAILIGLGGTMLYLKPWTSGSSAPTNAPETLSSPAPARKITAPPEDLPVNSANPIDTGGITLLSAAQSPAMPKTDEERSKAWQENQVSEDTDYALSAFAYQLGSKVLANTDDSVCFSPVSLYQVLSVITSGAGGTTQEQLLSLLGQGDVDTLKSEMQKLYQVNQQDTETDHLEFAGSLWLDEKHQDGENQVGFHQDWVMQAAMDYYCDVYAADFSSGAANAPLAAWINQHTRGSHGGPAGGFQHESQHGYGGGEHRLLSQPVGRAVSEHRPGHLHCSGRHPDHLRLYAAHRNGRRGGGHGAVHQELSPAERRKDVCGAAQGRR